MSDSLLTKYRPASFDEVVGHPAQVKALKKALEIKASHAYLFTGPAGVGKTTLARLASEAVGCPIKSLLEIDGATYAGADDMRNVTANLMYRPMGMEASRGILVDEVQALSKQAFQALLKSMEEPPPWAFWFLCTTEPTKVPEAVRTRCIRFDLKPVSSKVIEDLILDVCEAEGLKLADGVAAICAKEARGSPRQALANLGLCLEAKDGAAAAKLLQAVVKEGEAIELARALMRGAGWKELVEILGDLKDASPEGIRHVVRAYMTKVALGARSADDASHAMAILEEFSKPWNQADGLSPLVLAVGRLAL